jgi:FkbM family methyltransferase
MQYETPGDYSARAMNWPRVREMIGNAEGIGVAGRAGLALAYFTRRLSRRAAPVRLGRGRRIYLSRRSLDSDFETLREVFLPRKNAYRIDYQGATVLDIGAHKGYVGAYALLHGARAVVSYEPEAANFALLERAAQSFRERGAAWHTRRAAVGDRPGRSLLHLSAESWTHSLVSLPRGVSAGEIGQAEVEVVGIADALADLPDHRPVVMKLDVEGAECQIVHALTPELASRVDVVLLEAHEFAECTADDLTRSMTPLGFTQHATDYPAVARFQR